MSVIERSMNDSVSGASQTAESEATNEKQEEEEVELEDEYTEVKDLGERTSSVKTPAVWREIIKTSAGRDKAFVSCKCCHSPSRSELFFFTTQKVMQYSLKVYLLFHTTVGTSRFLVRRAKAPWESDLLQRLESTVSGLSLTRYVSYGVISVK